MHRLQELQWCARGGLYASHFAQYESFSSSEHPERYVAFEGTAPGSEKVPIILGSKGMNVQRK